MAFDGIVTQAITHELKNDLIGGKIDKIHQPDKNTILLGIYSNYKFKRKSSCSTKFLYVTKKTLN